MKHTRAVSSLIFAGTMLIFGTIGLFRRQIPLSSALLAFCRGLMGSLILLPIARLRGVKLFGGLDRRTLLLLILSGGIIGLNWMLLFEAYNHTTVAVATLCYYMQPTMVTLLSPLLFHERLTRRRLLCAVAAVAGMVFVSGVMDGDAGGDVTGILLGLGAAALYASVIILNKLAPDGDAYSRTIVQLGAAAVCMIPYLLLTHEDLPAVFASLDPRGMLMLLIVGIVHTGLAYALYFGSMQGLKAQSVAVLSYIDPVSALILSALLLGERMTVFGLLGAVLIVGSALVSELSPASET